MKVYNHIATSVIGSVIIVAFLKWQNAILFFIGGILTDFEDYLTYDF